MSVTDGRPQTTPVELVETKDGRNDCKPATLLHIKTLTSYRCVQGITMPYTAYPYYRSYLLRFWQESEQSPWRGSVQSVEDGATVAFGDLESLVLFLLNKAEPPLKPFLSSPEDDSEPTST